MPASLILKDRRIDAIEIAAPGDCRCYGNRVAGLHIFWLGVCRHREISDRAGEARRRIRGQRFHLEGCGFTFHVNLAPLGLTKWVCKERIGEGIIQVEQVEGRA